MNCFIGPTLIFESSIMYHSYFRIETLQFDAGIFGGEAPVDGGNTIVPVQFPCGHFFSHQVKAWDSAIEASPIATIAEDMKKQRNFLESKSPLFDS